MERLALLKQIAQDIRRARTALGLTQKTLAHKARISQAALARIEREPQAYNPSYQAIQALTEALHQEQARSNAHRPAHLPVKAIMHKKVASVQPTQTYHHALAILKQKNYSQLPVLDRQGHVLGTVYQRQLLDLAFQQKDLTKTLVRDHMEPALPQLDQNTPLHHVKPILQQWPAALITQKQRVIGIVTAYDWFKITP